MFVCVAFICLFVPQGEIKHGWGFDVIIHQPIGAFETPSSIKRGNQWQVLIPCLDYPVFSITRIFNKLSNLKQTNKVRRNTLHLSPPTPPPPSLLRGSHWVGDREGVNTGSTIPLPGIKGLVVHPSPPPPTHSNTFLALTTTALRWWSKAPDHHSGYLHQRERSEHGSPATNADPAPVFLQAGVRTWHSMTVDLWLKNTQQT